MKYHLFHIALFIFAASLACEFSALAQQPRRVVDLRGEWRFEIGDDAAWAQPEFSDSGWDRIHVPGFWEDQGYPGYDGWAWYRKRFTLSSDYRHEALFLDLGNIDDIDEVYVNGNFAGFMGSAPPEYETAYSEKRWYYIPTEFLRFDGENLIAVRVYDRELGGGIVRGSIGLYRDPNYLVPDQSLRGPWKLKAGDSPERASIGYDDLDWKTALVPAHWETQGLRDYDGFAWYRREFTLDPALHGKRLILLLGKIDDVDEVWCNGRRIGKTGRMPDEGGHYIGDDSYGKLRAYFIPPGLISNNARNVIAVRVYDGFRHGGIYEGPIGLIRQERYRQWEKTNRPAEKNPFDKLFNLLFGD